MSKIKIAELFYSIQGEGRYMGVPSVFLRTFGCNFKCAGFGMPRGRLSAEADEIAEVGRVLEARDSAMAKILRSYDFRTFFQREEARAKLGRLSSMFRRRRR